MSCRVTAGCATSRRLATRTGDRGERGVAMSGRIAVAVSGAGSNLRALHEAERRGELGGEIVLVVADRSCPALEWAAGEGIDTAIIPDGDDGPLADALAAA